MSANDPWGALLPAPHPVQSWRTDGRLSGETYVVKDNLDVAGQGTAGGSPALRAATLAATRSAAVIERLAAAGAHYAGRARCDELAFSLGGVNDVDGTPDNPVAPGHTCGGSSSGSAAAVAGGLATIGV